MTRSSPPAFAWDEWYALVGVRSIRIEEVDHYLRRISPYFAKHSYCSICLPVCAYNHKEWARDFDGFQTKLFPQVLMPDAPPPVDLPQEQARHFYARIHRS